jgi:hypothetical protein
MNYWVTVLTMSVLADPSRQQPINLLAILSRTATDSLPMCQEIVAKAMNTQSHEANSPFTFTCSKTSIDLDPKTLSVTPSVNDPAPFKPTEPPTVAVAHLTDASGEQREIDVFEIFRLSDFMSEGFAMNLCTQLIVGISEVHYTCEPDDKR